MRHVTAIILFAILSMTSTIVSAQPPPSFNFQGVARESDGDLLVNQSFNLQVNIRDVTATGSIVYSERHDVTTDGFGVFSAIIGRGFILSGNFTTIPWSTGAKHLEILGSF